MAFGRREEVTGPVFFVRDNGVGFPAEEEGRLFRPFQRLHSNAEFPGTGVGLSIVATIIEKHGGRVWGEAAPGTGANFCFTLGRGSNPPF